MSAEPQQQEEEEDELLLAAKGVVERAGRVCRWKAQNRDFLFFFSCVGLSPENEEKNRRKVWAEFKGAAHQREKKNLLKSKTFCLIKNMAALEYSIGFQKE